MSKTEDKYVIQTTEAARAYGVGAGLTKSIIRDHHLPTQRRANGREYFSIPGFQEFGRLVEKRAK